jgi:DNA-binding transcriptional ArsR family regulator
LPTQTQPAVIDPRLLKALAHPTRQVILEILNQGPSSPIKITRQLEDVSLNLVSHHIKVLRDLGCIELAETVKKRGATEHIYRATKRTFFSAEEWDMVEPSKRPPITATILRAISADCNRAFLENKFDEIPDNHLSRSPLELDEKGWSEVVDTLQRALGEIMEANARSSERAQASGEELKPSRVMIMQFPIGRAKPGQKQLG